VTFTEIHSVYAGRSVGLAGVRVNFACTVYFSFIFGFTRWRFTYLLTYLPEVIRGSNSRHYSYTC